MHALIVATMATYLCIQAAYDKQNMQVLTDLNNTAVVASLALLAFVRPPLLFTTALVAIALVGVYYFGIVGRGDAKALLAILAICPILFGVYANIAFLLIFGGASLFFGIATFPKLVASFVKKNTSAIPKRAAFFPSLALAFTVVCIALVRF